MHEVKGMKDLRIYQIYYNDETRRQLDPGFIPLDNTANERPDWYEYEPIRRLFQSHNFEDETWVGVFSPKFFQKTGMVSSQVINAVQQSTAEVVSFSPWFGHIAVYWNIFHQIECHHPGAIVLIDKLIKKIGFSEKIIKMPMTAQKTIFCNYFVAPVKIWRGWFACFDFVFNLSENKSCKIGLELNYGSGNSKYAGVPLKIFVCEALMSIVVMQYDLLVDYAAELKVSSLGFDFDNSFENIELLKILDNMKLDIDGMSRYDKARKELLAIHYGNSTEDAVV